MKPETISEFIDNHFEVTINERIQITFKNGDILHGFFKRYTESESKPYLKLMDKNQWEFFVILPENTISQKPTIINGDEVESMELIEISQ